MEQVYIKEKVYRRETNDFITIYFTFNKISRDNKIFDQIRRFDAKSLNDSGSGYYWFEGFSYANGDWDRGGYFYKPMINPSRIFANNIEGFYDGEDVYILVNMNKSKPENIKEY